MQTAYRFLQVERDEGIATLTLARPPLNVLTIDMIGEMEVALNDIRADNHLKAVVVRAEGKAFCAGVDVADHVADRVDGMIRGFGRVFTRLRTMPVPTIAAVHGAALGGGTELAIGCDLVLAEASARFGQPEIKLGVFPPIAAAFFPSLIGYQQAARLIFTGEPVSAEEAQRLGLVTEVVPDGELTDRVGALVGKLRGLSAAALRMAKHALLTGAERGGADALASIEQLYLTDLMATADANEGIQSFIEKRPPVWRDQ